MSSGMIGLEIRDREVRKMLDAGDRVYRGAAAWAMNRTWKELGSKSARLVARRLKLPLKYVRKRLKNWPAVPFRLTSELTLFVQAFNPVRMNATHDPAPGGGVSWPGTTVRGAFIARSPQGAKLVFRRKHWPASRPHRWGEPELPVESIKVPAEPSFKAALATLTPRHAGPIFEARFTRELIRRLNNAAR